MTRSAEDPDGPARSPAADARRLDPEAGGPEMLAEPDRDQSDLRSILANLSREICQPLESLRGGIGRLLAEPSRPITEAEKGQAQTMLTLCDDLGRLTRECLGSAEPGQG